MAEGGSMQIPCQCRYRVNADTVSMLTSTKPLWHSFLSNHDWALKIFRTLSHYKFENVVWA